MQDESFSARKSRFNGWVPFGAIGIQTIIVIVNLVASSGYTTRSEFTAHEKEFEAYKLQVQADLGRIREDQITKLGDIAGGIKDLNTKMQDNIRQDAQLKDHEDRVRALEGSRR